MPPVYKVLLWWVPSTSPWPGEVSDSSRDPAAGGWWCYHPRSCKNLNCSQYFCLCTVRIYLCTYIWINHVQARQLNANSCCAWWAIYWPAGSTVCRAGIAQVWSCLCSKCHLLGAEWVRRGLQLNQGIWKASFFGTNRFSAGWRKVNSLILLFSMLLEICTVSKCWGLKFDIFESW